MLYRVLDRRQVGLRALTFMGGAALIGGRPARAGDTILPGAVLRIGDQKGGIRALVDAAGALDHLPYTIEWSIFASASVLLEALTADAIDLGGVGDAPFLFAYCTGAPIRIALALSTGAERGLRDCAVLVPHDSPIRSPQDLIGRRVATVRGSIGHYFLLLGLAKHGLKPDQIQLLFLAPSDSKAALASAAIDAWSTWQPYVALSQKQDGALAVIDGTSVPRTGFEFYVASHAAIARNHAVIQDFLGRLISAHAWAAQNLDAFSEVWARETGLPVDVARSARADLLKEYQPIRLDQSVSAALGKIREIYVSGGVPIAEADLSAAYEPSFNAVVPR